MKTIILVSKVEGVNEVEQMLVKAMKVSGTVVFTFVELLAGISIALVLIHNRYD